MGRLKKTVVLVGMMGAGKTAVGRALAALLDVPFRDSDQALEEAANMTVAEVFARDGEAFFRDKEMQVIARLMALSPPGVLSTGGGAFLRPETRQAIAARGVALWLRAEEALLWERVRHKTTRPLLRTSDPRATLRTLIAEREPHYAQAGLVVDAVEAFSVPEMAAHVARALARARPDVLEVADA
ncbi:MAG: shikimate kinase [Pseudomonadota bacterium]